LSLSARPFSVGANSRIVTAGSSTREGGWEAGSA
jgi:hypothetical protein